VLRHDRTDEELLDLVRSLAAKRPNMSLEDLRRLPFITTLYRRFGTPQAAAKRAGVVGWPRREALPVLSKRELREHLRERLAAGEPIGAHDVDRHVRFSMSRIHPRWAVALARLGIRVDTPSRRQAMEA